MIELGACVNEGKPVPTFPRCLCRRRNNEVEKNDRKKHKRQLSGLRFTPALGRAMAVLVGHGLAVKRKTDSPVEFTLEPMLDTSPLCVAAAADMDLKSSVDHFLDHCNSDAAEKVYVPVGNILRSARGPALGEFDFSFPFKQVLVCQRMATLYR